MLWQNELTDRLRIRYPIVQAPMLGVTTPQMAAAISDQGGLGSLAVGGLSPERARRLICETKALTSNPFAVNIFTYDIPAIDTAKAKVMQDFLEGLCARHHIPFEKQGMDSFHFYSHRELLEVLLEEGVPIVSFTFGIPEDDMIDTLRAKGITLIGTATSLKEAQLLDQKGIDMIAAQGIEAGGHRGSFIDGDLPQVDTATLVTEITKNIRIPVLAAGGIYDGVTVRAALDTGAAGIQIGSAFLASDESAAIPAYKTALCNASEKDIVLTKAFSGRWARGIRNKLMTEIEDSGLDIPQYPIQNSLTTLLRSNAQKLNNKECTNLWAGRYAMKAESGPAGDIFRRIVDEAESID